MSGVVPQGGCARTMNGADCPRCKSIMVKDVFEDMGDDTGTLWFNGWRCVICGEILDPVIVRNRETRPSPLIGRARQKVPTRL
jgi:hypothetical protein